MKKVLTGLLAAGLGAGPGFAVGPMIRVQLEYHEISHSQLTELMAGEDADSGPALHRRLVTLGTEGKAKLVETCLLAMMNGQKASLESIREYIYPTEYDYGDGLDFAARPEPQVLLAGKLPNWVWHRPTMWSTQAFETRDLGVILAVEAIASADNALVDLRVAPETVDWLRLETWVEHEDRWGKAPLTTPVMGSLRTSNGVTLENGKFGLLGMLTPNRREGGLLTERKLLLLVKADVIPIVLPEEPKGEK